MNNLIMFVVGSIIFISYIFFYLRIIIRSHKKEITETSHFDANDSDNIMSKKQDIKKSTKASAKWGF